MGSFSYIHITMCRGSVETLTFSQPRSMVRGTSYLNFLKLFHIAFIKAFPSHWVLHFTEWTDSSLRTVYDEDKVVSTLMGHSILITWVLQVFTTFWRSGKRLILQKALPQVHVCWRAMTKFFSFVVLASNILLQFHTSRIFAIYLSLETLERIFSYITSLFWSVYHLASLFPKAPRLPGEELKGDTKCY